MIDCALRVDGILVAGDVSGTLGVFDDDFQRVATKEFDMPIWGVDVHPDVPLVAVAMADKRAGRGQFALYNWETGSVELEFPVDAPTWDAKFADRKVLVTTWGSGLIEVNIDDHSRTTMGIPGDLFGLSILSGSALSAAVTVSHIGIVVVSERDTEPSAELALRSKHVCYKNLPLSNGSIISGSADSILTFPSLSTGGDDDDGKRTIYQSHRTSLENISAIAEHREHLIIGSLSGDLALVPKSNPSLTSHLVNVGSSVWNIVPSWNEERILIAEGDGDISEYSIDEILASSQGVPVSFGPESLSGVKVFLSYSSEDRQAVRDVYQHLLSVGCKPWMDVVDILPGQDWKYEIAKGIKSSDYVLIFFSEGTTKKRGYIQREIREALNLLAEIPEGEVLVIPVRLDECSIPTSLSDKQWVNLFDTDGMRRLLLSMYTNLPDGGE